MARFSLMSTSELESLEENATNSNTKRSTCTWLNVFRAWASWRQFDRLAPEEYAVSELEEKLCLFFAEIKRQDGKDYEPDSLAVMQAAIDRHLNLKGYSKSILKDREFSRSRLILEGKARRLRMEGRGKRPNATRALTKAEEEKLWSLGRLGSSTPRALLHTVFYKIGQQFGLRARQEHESMTMANFEYGTSDDGPTEFVVFHEDPTKTRGSGLHPKKRDGLPKMFATGGKRCPVKLYNLYISKQPEHLKKTGRFYLGIDWKKTVDDDVCYTDQPMGKNKLGKIMKELVAGTGIDMSGKKIANHSVRKTTVKKLKAARLPETSIVKITGHKNPAGLRDYAEGDESKFHELPNALESVQPSASTAVSAPCASSSVDRAPIESLPSAVGVSHPSSISAHAGSNMFFNCSVSFDIQNN